ncbi:beta strand repeat-containing protein [Actinokineospora sp. 24-640]
MQTWAKRGIQTALVTGGLLMLGTGIAAADDNIHPDTPPSPLDASVQVPVKVGENVIATPQGKRHLPAVDRQIAVTPAAVTPRVPAAKKVTEKVAKAAADENDVLRGNKAAGNVVAPVKVTGNAVALGDDVTVADSSSQHAAHTHDMYTDGSDKALAGNAVHLAYGLPIDVSGNAVAAGGSATTANSSEQSAAADGDIATNGDKGVFSGNVMAGHGATPVELSGNGLAAAGIANTASEASSSATSGGTIENGGDDGVLSGNGGGAPVAVPVRGSGNSAAVLGIADTRSSADTTAQAGDERPDLYGVPSYIETDGGHGATMSGNAAQPAVSGPIALDCNGVGGGGNVDSQCVTTADAGAGGGTRTFGDASVLSGAIASGPVALPAQGQGNCGAVAGNCDVTAVNEVGSDAGGDGHTRGHDSVLSGSTGTVPVSGPVDLCGNATGGLGKTDVVCDNTSTTHAGGATGTTGSDSIVGGNHGSAPVAVPVAGLGTTAGALGDAETVIAQDKVATAGGANSTDDDAALGAANLVTVPVAGPVQSFSNGAGVGATVESEMDGTTDVTAGGPSRAKGTMGTGSGNVGQVPVAAPTQLFGSGATAAGNGKHNGVNATSSAAGGHALTDGADGRASGNLVTVPVASTAQGFGVAGAAAGDNVAVADNATATAAGGDGATSGRFGTASGNVVGAQALPIGQTFGPAVSGAAGDASGAATSSTHGTSGGDLSTNGDHGTLSGNLVDSPVAAMAQGHGDGVAAVAADSAGVSDNITTGSAGGVGTTSGAGGRLNGMDVATPVGADAPVYDVPVAVVADAMTSGVHANDVTVGEREPTIEVPETKVLEATELPTLPKPGSLALPRPFALTGGQARAGDPITGLLGGVTAGTPVGALTGGTLLGGVTGGSNPLGGLTGGNPLGALTGGVTRSEDPITGLLGGVTGGDLLGGVTGGSPVGALTGGDLLGGLTGGNPLSGVTGGLTRSEDPITGLLGGMTAGTPVGALTGGDLLGGVTDGDLLGGVTGGNPLSGVTGGVTRSDDPITGLLGGVTAGTPAGAVTGGDLLDGASGRNPLGGVTGGLTRSADPITDVLGNLVGGQGGPLGAVTGGDLLGGVTGGNPLGSVTGGGLTRSEDPITGLVGNLVGGQGGPLGSVTGGDLLGGDLLGGVTGGGPLGGLTGGLTRSEDPITGLVGNLVGGQGGPLGAVTGGDLLGGVTGGDALGGLTGGGPLGGLTGGLTRSVDPTRTVADELPARGVSDAAKKVVRDVVGQSALGGLSRSGEPASGQLDGAKGLSPMGSLTGGTTALQGLDDITIRTVTGMAAGLLGADVPTPRDAAPVMPGLTGVSGLENVEGSFSGTLVETPAVDRFPVRTPALSDLDSRFALPTADGSSLADTRSRLSGLVGRIG